MKIKNSIHINPHHFKESSWDQRFEIMEDLFQEGQFSILWSKLITFKEIDLPKFRRSRYYFYILTCAVYGIGNLTKAKKLNRLLDFRFHPTMRYRLSLRLKDFVTANRLRHSHNFSTNEEADFRHTLGLHCLTKGKFKFGFHFYQERYRAINTPKSLMAPLQYHYLTDDPKKDSNIIVLEQGLGEVLISLLHIKISGNHEKSIFCGMAKYKKIVSRYFPNASYHTRLKLSEFEGKEGILAVDFLKRSWDKKRTLLIESPLDKPIRTRHSKPKIGICWRGGAGQNRREERHIPLKYFLEFLPKEKNYIVLQYDITEDEKKLLEKHPNIQIPLVDLTNDALITFDIVRELAGVISVAGANWHLAGSADIPFLAIMHKNSHWLWGKDAKASSVYPSATTIPKPDLSFEIVNKWSDNVIAQWHYRPIDTITSNNQLCEKPIFITGLPGQALSKTMYQFIENGLWVNNKPEYLSTSEELYGSEIIRKRLIFNILKKLGVSEEGHTFPPLSDQLPPFPWLRFQIEKALHEEGYLGNVRWGYQDFRLVLLWPFLARAYPEATWVIVDQDIHKVTGELLESATHTLYSASYEYWSMYLNVFNDRLLALKNSSENVINFHMDSLSETDIRSLIS